MRYLGSKRKLLSAITDLAEARGVLPGAHVLDVFSGTACVGRHFKEAGYQVSTNDRMELSHALQRALVVTDALPPDLDEALAAARGARPCVGLIARQYSPLGPSERRFFMPEAARAIDGALRALRRLRPADPRGPEGATFFLVLAALLEGASRVANIAGTYGAYLKSWQANAHQALRLDAPPPVPAAAGACAAYCEDANELVARVPCDLLYIDPPYNGREYSANYHVLEVIAQAALATRGELRALEGRIYGKTGLLKYEKSEYCKPRGVEEAFRALIADAEAEHVIVSYSEEGLLSREAIEGALADGLGCGRGGVHLERVAHKRFRSDAAARAAMSAKGKRSYKVLPGHELDGVYEWLFHARRAGGRSGRSAARSRPRAVEASASR